MYSTTVSKLYTSAQAWNASSWGKSVQNVCGAKLCQLISPLLELGVNWSEAAVRVGGGVKNSEEWY